MKHLDRAIRQKGTDLGCVYVDESTPDGPSPGVHPMWTHGEARCNRKLDRISRAELVHHGSVPCADARPTEVLPPMTDDQVRAAARAEICGYWAWASRRPAMWRYPVIADLGLTSMARGRFAMQTGQLRPKAKRSNRPTHRPG